MNETIDGWIYYKHICYSGKAEHGGYGPAIDVCLDTEDGKLYVDNGEYETQVNYCPFCGYKAKVQIDG